MFRFQVNPLQQKLLIESNDIFFKLQNIFNDMITSNFTHNDQQEPNKHFDRHLLCFIYHRCHFSSHSLQENEVIN